jgi:phosphoribosylamine--glycine ligase
VKVTPNQDPYSADQQEQAQVRPSRDDLVSASGRVMLVATTAPTIAEAYRRVYQLLDGLDTTGMFYRHDIGAKALKAIDGLNGQDDATDTSH